MRRGAKLVDDRPWERQPGESWRWYNRFDQHYRPLGPDRSLLAAYKHWLSETGRERQKKPIRAPQHWTDTAAEWHWPERAEAWDEAERQQRLADERAERLKWRQKRRDLLASFYDKLETMLKKVEPKRDSPPFSQLTVAVRTATQELRAEYNDEPEQRQVIEHNVPGLERAFEEALNRIYGENDDVEEV